MGDIMSAEMSEFRLSFLGQRRRSDAAPPATPLDEIAGQVRLLDEAARAASGHIAGSAGRLRDREGSEGDGELLAELAASVASRIEGVRADCAELAGLLQRAQRLATPAPSLRPAEPVPEPPSPSATAAGSGDPRELATAMAIAGATPAEIEARLRSDFGVADARTLLGEIFGEVPAGGGR